MPVLDHTNAYKKFPGQWVAFGSDKVTVISAGENLDEVIAEARARGVTKPIVLKIPEEVVPFIGSRLCLNAF